MRPNWSLLLIPVAILVWILSASRPGARVESCLDGCAVPGDIRDGDLRVISLNMLHGFPKFEHVSHRLELIANEINRLEPDIVMLQEVPWTLKIGSAAGFLAEKTGMNYVYLRANGNRWAIAFEEGSAILSRYPLADPEFLELRPRAGFFEHRIVLHANAVTSMGEVGLYVTHLTDGEADNNRAQSGLLLEFVTSEDVKFAVIAGDFNARPESPQIQLLSSVWVDTFALVHPGSPGFTCCIDNLTQETASPDKRIDYIFLKSGNTLPEVVASELVYSDPFAIAGGWLWVSDHIGLLVDLNFVDQLQPIK
jgi:endonuclease/exonuclease/phosphatase family metal-dependent hydrolase